MVGAGAWLRAAATAAALLAAGPALSQMLMLDRPQADGELRGRGVTLVVRYSVSERDRFKVEAAWIEPFAGEKLAQLSVELGPGESAAYAPPGRQQQTYRFSRDADVLIVTVHNASRLRFGRESTDQTGG